ncbi:MAG: transcription antitermination factor NusB [Deltaproteobacteria bacterium]|nr:MAG: transcription antitermination factor NusB [Deltaproteobacteria bacterium]
MGIRRKARELALQALFCMDMTGDASDEMLQRFCDHYDPPAKARPFFLELIRGVNGSRALIDRLIERFSRNWRISRMSCVDRNIMRIAIYEMLFCSDIPAKVSINEAIDIGKKYGSEESGAFINGILDSVRIDCEDPPLQKTPDPQPQPAD